MNGADTLVKDYRLAYNTSAATQRSRLISLTECDGAASPTCPYMSAANYVGVGQWRECLPSAAWGNPGRWVWDLQRWFVIDVNGDGRADLVNIFNDNGSMSVDVRIARSLL